MSLKKINCWEYKRCGREPGGVRADDKGVCPAAANTILDGINMGSNAGRVCWLVAGTFCDGVVQGTVAEKKDSCRECEFYKEVQAEETNSHYSLNKLDIVAMSHIGLVRKANEDRYLVRQLEDDSMLFAVADGLGGHEAGDYAAEILRGRLAGIRNIPKGEEQEVLARLAVETDQIILEIAEKKPELEGMGTTFLCVLLRDNKAYWVHVGDSRFSIWRQKNLLQITRDQNLARFLMEEGEISREEVPDHYSRHVLDQALGSAMEEPETGKVDISAGDLLLLTTDGLHNEVSENKIISVLDTEVDLKTTVNKLVKAALDKGGRDNITIVAVSYRPLEQSSCL